MKARELLEQIGIIDATIESLMIEKKNWQDTKEKIYGITTSYGESVTIGGELHNMEKIRGNGNVSAVETMAIENCSIELEYDKRIKALHDEKNRIIDTMRRTNIEQFKFLHKVYVQHFTLKEVAKSYDKTYSWATSVHGRALQAVQKILDEGDE